jgi:hypothetical protein
LGSYVSSITHGDVVDHREGRSEEQDASQNGQTEGKWVFGIFMDASRDVCGIAKEVLCIKKI